MWVNFFLGMGKTMQEKPVCLGWFEEIEEHERGEK